MPYPVQNRAVSTVATAPSPAASGTTLTLATGQGAWFADPAVVGAYPLTVVAAGQIVTPANSEMPLCAGKSGDVLTIIRDGSPRSVVAGDDVFASWTAEHVTQRDATGRVMRLILGS